MHDSPLDPRTLRALTALSRRSLHRRRFLSGAAGLSGLVALAACAPPPPPEASPSSPGVSGDGATPTVTRSLPTDTSATDRSLRFANWTQYIDHAEGGAASPTLQAFTRQSGIKVDYLEEIDDNDTYANSILPRLRAGQSIDRDLFVFSSWMIHRLIRDQLLAPLEPIPHAAGLLDKLKNVSSDPGRQYSLVWQSGFCGIGYHKKKLGREIRSVADLWQPDLKGKVVLLSELRDTLGLIMLAQGVDVAGAFTRTQLEAAADVVKKQIAEGQVRRVRGGSYTEDLKAGNALAGMVWSGDISTLRSETKDDGWEFVMPDSGGLIWSDDVAVPVTSPHRKAAAQLLDYYYTPEVAAQVAAAVGYICPVKGARAAMEKIDPELAKDPMIFPTEDHLARTAHEFRALDAQEDADYSALWATVVGN